MGEINKLLFAVLLISSVSMVAGCVTWKSVSSSGYSVDEIYIVEDGATIIWCERFTGSILFSIEDQNCLVKRGTARPEGGQISRGNLDGPLRLKVKKIRDVNAIDVQDELVFVEDLATGKRYLDAGVLRQGHRP